MEVELRNESEMPANFNWNIPVNMEACHLVRRCEKVDLTSVAAEVACKIQLRHKFRQQTRPEAEVWNAKFSQCRQDVDGAGGVAWIGLASYHYCAMRCPCQGHIPPRGRQLCTVIAVPSNLVEDGGPPHAVFLLLSPVRLQCSRHLTFYHNSI